MRRWTRTEDQRLLNAATDEAMQREFPDVKLGTLQRRRRQLRAAPTQSEGVSLALSGLEGTRYDPKNFTALIVGDLQSPYYDDEALQAFNFLLVDMSSRSPLHKPVDVLIDNGDHYDNYAISRFKKDSGRGSPENFVKEVEIGTAIFESWRVILDDDADIILLMGNHEERWRNYLLNRDTDHMYALLKARGNESLSFENAYGLNDLDVKCVPYMKPTLFGDVVISHGTRASSSAGQTARDALRNKYGTSVVVNHVHTGAMVVQRYLTGTKVAIENFTLCDLDGLGYAEFPNWAHGFTYMVVRDGVSYLRPVVMINKCFEFNGYVYTPNGRV